MTAFTVMYLRTYVSTYVLARVNNIYIEESILLTYTPVETRNVKL